MEVNKKLKEYLDSHGITQAFISRKTGIPYKTINDICNSVVKISADNLGKIAAALNVSADIFLK